MRRYFDAGPEGDWQWGITGCLDGEVRFEFGMPNGASSHVIYVPLPVAKAIRKDLKRAIKDAEELVEL